MSILIVYVFSGNILYHWDDPSCALCQDNEGICFDRDGGHIMDGCVCLPSRSGDFCENILGEATHLPLNTNH